VALRPQRGQMALFERFEADVVAFEDDVCVDHSPHSST
jgi:hypothetical protein